MSNPQHAADDGSLARSTGGAAARGAMLIALAVVIGLLLLAFALDDPETVVAGDDTSSQTDTGDDGGDDSGAGDTDSDTGDSGDTATTSTTSAPTTLAPLPANDPRPPAEVNVLVANGTGGRGVAGAVSDKLKARAYISEASNAPSTADSVVFYREGYEADARAVAEIIGTTADLLQPAPTEGTIAVAQNAIDDGRLAAANVIVIIGNDERIPVG